MTYGNSFTTIFSECPEPLPSPNGHYLGNLHQVGNKRLHKCNPGYKLAPHKNTTNETITCSAQSGKWEPDIHECLAGKTRLKYIHFILKICMTLLPRRKYGNREGCKQSRINFRQFEIENVIKAQQNLVI